MRQSLRREAELPAKKIPLVAPSADHSTSALEGEKPSEIRPWGWFEYLQDGKNYRVKRLCVAPGKRTSLQYHHQRSEHWVVVQGTGKARIGDVSVMLDPQSQHFVPTQALHRIENVGKNWLEIIEVQTGPRCAEYDITRIEDDYGRA